MENMKDISQSDNVLVIIPVHNEEANLKRFLPQLLPIIQELNIDLLAVDDCSTDNSLQILSFYSVPTIQLFSQMGYGTAIQTGYKYALKKNYAYLIQIDGDGQHDPRFLRSILRCLKNDEADVVIGSRFLEVTDEPLTPFEKLYKGSPIRLVGIRIFRLILRCLTSRKITDPTTGYIGMNKKSLQFACSHSFPFDFPDADMILTFLRNHFRIQEIPVYMYHNHATGYLHRGCKPIWYVFKVTLSLLISSIRSREV